MVDAKSFAELFIAVTTHKIRDIREQAERRERDRVAAETFAALRALREEMTRG